MTRTSLLFYVISLLLAITSQQKSSGGSSQFAPIALQGSIALHGSECRCVSLRPRNPSAAACRVPLWASRLSVRAPSELGHLPLFLLGRHGTGLILGSGTPILATWMAMLEFAAGCVLDTVGRYLAGLLEVGIQVTSAASTETSLRAPLDRLGPAALEACLSCFLPDSLIAGLRPRARLHGRSESMKRPCLR